MFLCAGAHDSVWVSTSTLPAGGLCSILRLDKHDVLGVNTWLSTLGCMYPL